MKKALIAVAAGVILFAAFLLLKKNKPESAVQDSAYNLIFISIDTVRTDFLQLYDSGGAPTPNLNRIAEKSFLFTRAISQAPYTLPSHCSMLTGTYPVKHRVQENTAVKLSDQAVTLAEVLKKNNYKTAGFIGSVVLAANTGIQQGFDVYDDAFSHSNIKMDDLGGIQKEAGLVSSSFERWFAKRNTGKFFAFVHFYDPHMPYEPPAAFLPAQSTAIDRYKAELRYVDFVIGALYDKLDRQGIWNDTVLVITGDHGEMFGEHQENEHGYFIYQEAVKVPLLILLPGQKQKFIVQDVVQLVDLMPTILNVLRIKIPDSVQGESFADTFQQKALTSRFAFSESLTSMRYFGTTALRSIQDQNYKFIDNPKPELYNLKLDPKELSNLFDQQKDIADRMKLKLTELVGRFSETSQQPDTKRTMSAEEKEKLAALGYLDSTNDTPVIDSSRDAKDYIKSWTDMNKIGSLLDKGEHQETLSLIKQLQEQGITASEFRVYEARALEGLGNHEEAIAILEDLTKKDSENVQAWMALAFSLRRAGKADRAIDIYLSLMEKEDSLMGLQNYSRLLIRLNRKEELSTYLKRKQGEGKFTDRHNEMLGEIYLNLRDFNQAQIYLEKALITHPDSAATYINYSAFLISQGKIQQAVTLLEDNRSRFSNPDYLLQLGRTYNQAGLLQKELDVFKSMIESFPQDPRGYFFAAKFLLQHKGNPRSVIELAERGLRLNPSEEFQPFGYFLLGDAYTALGMKEQAKHYLARAEELRATADR